MQLKENMNFTDEFMKHQLGCETPVSAQLAKNKTY